MTTWKEFYRTKVRQQNQVGLRCPGNCGRKPTESHHLWRRRPDHPSLQEDWNIIQTCHKCHMEEWRIQVRAGLMKMEKYGPAYIEHKLRNLPGKANAGLPKHFTEALRLYRQGKKAFIDY